MKAPNFFIVGAPKCGTTALSEYLRAHPQVFMSTPKEPHYFALDLPAYRYTSCWKDYLKLFDEAAPQHRVIGEASVYYLYSKVAITEIKQFLPEAKLVVLLRDPVELAYSMHSQALCSRNETIMDFAKAWRCCDSRRRGVDLPKQSRDAKILLYDEIACLGNQLERLLKIFPREQVRWFFYDDFCRNPRQVYLGCLDFLELEDDRRIEFPRINANKRNQFQWLAQFTQKPPRLLVRAAIEAKRALGLRRWGVLPALRARNRVEESRAPLESTLYNAMLERFEPDIRRLMEITGRDLSHWFAPSHTKQVAAGEVGMGRSGA